MCDLGWYLIIFGTVLCFIGGAMTPKEDKRYKTGKKNNESEDSSNDVFGFGFILLILGGLIVWLC